MIKSRYKYISWLLPAAAIVLVLLIAIPAYAQVSTIDVVAPGDFGFGDFEIGNNLVAATDGSVTITDGGDHPIGYSVTARDLNQAGDSGFMLTAGTPLASELQISDDDGANYEPASTGLIYAEASHNGVLSFDAKQVIAGTETVGAYTIIIEFAGSITY